MSGGFNARDFILFDLKVVEDNMHVDIAILTICIGNCLYFQSWTEINIYRYDAT